ncbi:MAG: lysophospholipid acyltransferase family protein [Acidobacteriota bacterium]
MDRSVSHRAAVGPAERTQKSLLRRLLGKYHVYGVFWYKLHFFAVRAVPKWLYPVLLPTFVAFFFVALRSVRRAITSNLEVVLGPCGFLERQRRIWRNLWVYSWCLTERYEALATGRLVETDNEGWEHWRRLNESGQGFVLATAHIGPWEAGSAYPADVAGRTIHIVREEEINREAQEFFEEMLSTRARDRYRVHFANRSPDLGPRLLRALRRGDIVALQSDRAAHGGRTLQVELFDRPFTMPIGAAIMARTAEVPILPVFLYRTGRMRARLVFHPPIHVERDGDRDESMRRALSALGRTVETAIRRDPCQWFCFRPLWPDD